MSTLEIILSMMLCIVSAMTLLIMHNSTKEADDTFFAHMCDLNKMYLMAQDGKLDKILDVEEFNKWFNSPKDNDIYAHPGIFLRLDKLSQNHLDEYVKYQTEGLLGYGDFDFERMQKFEDEIRYDWMKKLRGNEKKR